MQNLDSYGITVIMCALLIGVIGVVGVIVWIQDKINKWH